MTDTLTIGTDEAPPEDPSEAPEGAEGDGNRVDLEPNASTDPPEEDHDQDGDRPEWLDEKFESPEDLQKAYQELEKKMGQGDDSSADSDSDSGEDGSPLTLEDVTAEYIENGEISEEAYEKFEKAGLSKDLVDSLLENQANEGNRVKNELLETVGGEEAYEKISEWALANKSESEIEAFNKAMRSGDADIAKMALRGLRADYEEANGNDPDLVKGDGSNVRTGPEGYDSWDEVHEDMANPKYKTSRSYRAKVDEKLAASDL